MIFFNIKLAISALLIVISFISYWIDYTYFVGFLGALIGVFVGGFLL